MITDTIQLTSAELEMIKIKREKDDLEKREKELKRISDLDKQVVREKDAMKKALSNANKSALYMKMLFQKLNKAKPGLYALETYVKMRTYKVSFYTYNEDYSLSTENIYWEEDLSFDLIEIVRKDCIYPETGADMTRYSKYIYRIHLDDQFHSSSNKLTITGVYGGRTYVNIMTCHTKIQDDIDTKAMKMSYKIKKEEWKVKVKEMLSESYPDAQVSISNWESGDATKVEGTIAFDNGYSISFYSYSDSMNSEGKPKIGYVITNINYKQDVLKYIDAISKIK
jgi:hypothetical protein